MGRPPIDHGKGRLAAELILKAERASLDLIEYAQFMMTDEEEPDDARKTSFETQRFHRVMAAALEKIELGEWNRLIIILPPRHGKTKLAKLFISWYMGRNPRRSIIFATYNQDYAKDIGRDVLSDMTSARHRLAFPNSKLRKGSRAADRMKTLEGGDVFFVGRGGSITGRGGHLNLVDDILKDDEEATSDNEREKAWQWFQNTFLSRRMSKDAAVVFVGTRWHEDDPLGRLIDPENKHYRAKVAARYKIIHLSAIAGLYGADAEDPLGRKEGETLWPKRFDRPFFEEIRDGNPQGFAKLYQGIPTAADGDYFTRAMIMPYEPYQLPRELTRYAASDHALSLSTQADDTVLGGVGICKDGDLWVLPETFIGKIPANIMVDRMIALNKIWHPMIWWAESEHISKAIAPFLRQQMREQSSYINIRESSSNKDPLRRAQPLIALASQGKLRLPRWVAWYEKAVNQLLKFPYGKHDDFVSFLSHIGQGLDSINAPILRRKKPPMVTGTIEWVKAASNANKREEKRLALVGSL